MVKNATTEYNKYLTKHIENVQIGYDWMKAYIPELFEKEILIENNIDLFDLDDQIFSHDESKYTDDEWDAYADYFYKEKSAEVKEAFNYAWLHHIHHNPHHWQHWVLMNDDDGTVALDMPYRYIIEMVCDWWSFGLNTDKYDEIFKWYSDHKNTITISDKTRKTVEDILDKLKDKLTELELI